MDWSKRSNLKFIPPDKIGAIAQSTKWTWECYLCVHGWKMFLTSLYLSRSSIGLVCRLRSTLNVSLAVPLLPKDCWYILWQNWMKNVSDGGTNANWAYCVWQPEWVLERCKDGWKIYDSQSIAELTFGKNYKQSWKNKDGLLLKWSRHDCHFVKH